MNKHQLKVAWLCPYPIDKLPNEKVKYNQSKCFHPASWLVHLSNALGKLQNIQLHIFTETNWVNKDYHFIHNNIYFHILKNPYKIPFFKRGFPSKIPISLITGYYLSSIKFLRKIKIIQPDLIHSHGTEGQYALFGLRSFYPLVISIQGVMKFMSNFNDMYQKKILYYENYSIKRAKNFGSRTEWVNNYIKSINPNANIYYMPEAINPVYFKESNVDRKDIIIYVGDLRERKGIIYLIRAFKEVTKIYSKYKLYIVGDSKIEYLNFLKKSINELEISSNVKFLGKKNASEIKKYHDIAKLFVFPTLIDNSPNSVAEAMVSGLPVISSNTGGIPSMIDDSKNGILVPSKNSDVLAEKIIHLIKNKDFRSKLGENATFVARQRHGPNIVAEITVNVYKDILISSNKYLNKQL